LLLDASLLTPPVRLAATLLALPAYAVASVRAPWRTWLARNDRQHVWLGSLVLLVLLWSLRAGVTPGLTVQFLLMGALTLMHGWRLAVVGAGVVLGIDALQHHDLADWPANLLCSGLVPASVTYGLHRWVQARLPHNYFVYFFATAFAGSFLAYVLAALARLALLAASGALPFDHVGEEYLLLLPMLATAEAFLNGLVIAVAVIYSPEWVATFDDRLYLRRR
jgi:uncharacterized membrane protein